MSGPSNLHILKEFHDLANAGSIEDLQVQYHVSGGPPGEQFIHEIVLPGGDAPIELKTKDETNPETITEKRQLLSLDLTEKRSLFKLIGSGALASLSALEKPLFLPDSVIGSLTIQVKDKEPTTVHFLVDEVDRRIQNKPVPAEIADIVSRLDKIVQGGDI